MLNALRFLFLSAFLVATSYPEQTLKDNATHFPLSSFLLEVALEDGNSEPDFSFELINGDNGTGDNNPALTQPLVSRSGYLLALFTPKTVSILASTQQAKYSFNLPPFFILHGSFKADC